MWLSRIEVHTNCNACCKHIAVVIHALVDIGQDKDPLVELTCTEVLQSFNKPRRFYNGSPIKTQDLFNNASIVDPRLDSTNICTGVFFNIIHMTLDIKNRRFIWESTTQTRKSRDSSCCYFVVLTGTIGVNMMVSMVRVTYLKKFVKCPAVNRVCIIVRNCKGTIVVVNGEEKCQLLRKYHQPTINATACVLVYTMRHVQI
ncbi:hypothetical protein GQR58_012118 [Nymphon striatum]|nr:hypothetical protein GQR58_012118 [Nymphon striatum]